MTTIKSARSIFMTYPYIHNASQQYVPLEEYETLEQKRLELGETVSRIMDDNYELVAGLAKRDSDYKVALALLRQWAEISNELPVGCASWPELNQVVTATKAALDAQSGNNPSTSRQSN